MDFSLSEEQAMLQDSVSRFVANQPIFDRARFDAANGEAFSRSDWKSFSELGWLALMIPEELDGIGGTAADAAILMEGLGRGLVAAPYVSSAVIAPLLLAQSAAPAMRNDLLARIASGDLFVALATEEPDSHYHLDAIQTQARRDEDGFRLTGRKIVVPDGSNADLFIVSARFEDDIGLFLVPGDSAGVSRRAYRTIDSRGAADLDLEDIAIASDGLLLAGAEAREALSLAIDTASILFAAEAVGCMTAAMEQTAEYLKTRQQFGRTLSQFQVLTHRMSDMLVRVENARSMLLRGLASLESDRFDRAEAISATMVAILEAGEFVCGQCIQLHGGIGMADETMVGHFYKRTRAIGSTYGDGEFHLQRYLNAGQSKRRSA